MARSDSAKINLALHVLRDACVRCGAQSAATPEVRLALNVLDTSLPNCAALPEFWRHAASKTRHPWESGHAHYGHIVGRLQNAGWQIDAANVP
ncbi:hypothetical protein GCM10011395_34400 [Sphingomonas psychrolutea]|uniref:Uncharacterized protein n=1 Tax=Sphingomonas psychrolutea TaxID=1259676 RepID=A0ABQ1H813_9SPHN|nr:hypothetical protein GCM10011395_34400 [Sphingomonas psychrolutea]